MVNIAFLPFVIDIGFTDGILWNPIEIKGSFDDFWNNQNWNPKQVKFQIWPIISGNDLAYHAKKQITTEKMFYKIEISNLTGNSTVDDESSSGGVSNEVLGDVLVVAAQVQTFIKPGDCIIKLITAVICGFCNKLECLALTSLFSLV